MYFHRAPQYIYCIVRFIYIIDGDIEQVEGRWMYFDSQLTLAKHFLWRGFLEKTLFFTAQ